MWLWDHQGFMEGLELPMPDSLFIEGEVSSGFG